MGQYYRGCILTRPDNPYMNTDEVSLPQYYAFESMYNRKIAAAFHPHNFNILNCGLRLLEQAYTDTPLMKVYEYLLSEDYYGYPVVWAGDYSPNENSKGKNLYAYVTEEILTESIKKIDHTEKDTWHGKEYTIDEKYFKPHKYLVNTNKQLYVKIPQHYSIHPLPLLCWDGGVPQDDYIGYNMDLVGSWAYDCVGVTDEIPEGYTELEHKKVIDENGNYHIFKEK